MDSQHIFILVKPDDVERELVDGILGCIEAKEYKLKDLKFMQAEEGVLRAHYARLADKLFFPEIVRYMTRGSVVATIFSGTNVIEGVRALAGATNPTQTVPSFIRDDLTHGWGHRNIENPIRTSDSDENAEEEILLWFN